MILSPGVMTILFLITVFGFLFFEILENKLGASKSILKVCLYFLILCSLYNFIVGLQMALEWGDFVNYNAELFDKMSSKRKGGIVVLFIKLLPYILIGAGGFWSYLYFKILRIYN